MQAWWCAMDSTLKAGVIGAVATCVAALLGFGGVILTLILQGRQSRRAAAEIERRRLRAAMYEDAVGICRDVTDSSIDLSNYLTIMAMQLQAASEAAETGADAPLPAARFPEILERYAHFSDAAIRVITLIETRLIVDPRLIIFRTALNTVLHDTRMIIHGSFATWVMPNIPIDNPQGGILPYTPPVKARAEKIAAICNAVVDSLGDANAYSEDLLVALQNLLLGDLFDNEVPTRQPVDPDKRAVTLSKADELETWFRTTTAWGKEVTRIEAETVQRFASNGGAGTT